MYKIFFALWVLAGIPATAFTQQKQDMDKNRRTLVAYFSASGTTARAAGKLAEATGGILYEITPARPYTAADLDWNDKRSRSSVEMNDPGARPALGGKPLNTDSYDVIFIGYPIWWNLAPRIVDTFIESHDLKGKTVIPFATSGSSGIANSAAALKRSYPDLNWKAGKLLNRMDGDDIRKWIDESGY
ncbi:flavodoxin [Rikenella microfusus]|uniref:flavodoxin n=1 Tax=Rikenella microfusus TaxID=28139 RepID=UPI00248F341A|nr:flavodoxin [Rikenella microfusus]